MTTPRRGDNDVTLREHLEKRLDDEREARETGDINLIRRLEKLDDALEQHALRQATAIEELRKTMVQVIDENRTRSDLRMTANEVRLSRVEQRLAAVMAVASVGGTVVGVTLGWALHFVGR